MVKEENKKKTTKKDKNEEVMFSSPHLCINALISGGYCPTRKAEDKEEDSK